MLTREDKWFLFYLTAGYLAVAEVLSWETSKFPLCIVVSQYQSANNQSGYQTCATFHEGVVRGFFFVWGYINHDNVTAIGTLLIALFTWTLWRSSTKLWIVTNETIKLARAEFNSTHRPRIRIKNVWIMRPLVPDEPVVVDVLLVNVGNAPAVIHSFGIDFNVIDPNLGMLPGDLEPPNLPISFIGETCGLGFTLRVVGIQSGAAFDEARVDAINDETRTLICFGQVGYYDTGPVETRRIRRTSFYRVFKPFPSATDGMGRFIIPEKPDRDYEYED